jgi:hypothetical protein
MEANARHTFWIMTLLLSSLSAPMAVRAADAPELATDPGADTIAPAEPVCRDEVYTGSRIKTLVCPGDDAYHQGMRLGDQLQRPGDRQFTRSTRFPGVTVRSGATSGVNIHN